MSYCENNRMKLSRWCNLAIFLWNLILQTGEVHLMVSIADCQWTFASSTELQMGRQILRWEFWATPPHLSSLTTLRGITNTSTSCWFSARVWRCVLSIPVGSILCLNMFHIFRSRHSTTTARGWIIASAVGTTVSSSSSWSRSPSTCSAYSVSACTSLWITRLWGRSSRSYRILFYE